MDLFTQSVDASLWSSRAYDDIQHDDDPQTAQESTSPITYTATSTPPPQTLLIADGHIASAITSVLPSTPLGTFQGAAIPSLKLHKSNDISLLQLSTPIPEHRATKLISVLFETVTPSNVIILTTTSAKNVTVLPRDKIHVLSTNTSVATSMQEPDFLRGVPAAVMTHAVLHDLPATCLQLVTELAVASTAEAEQLHGALAQVLTPLGHRIAQPSLDTLRVRLSHSNPTPPAMYT